MYQVREYDRLDGEGIGHNGRLTDVQFSPDGRLIVSTSEDGMVKIWLASGRLLKTLEGHSDYVWGARFSPDGQLIASVSVDGSLKLWDVATGWLLRTIPAHGPCGSGGKL